MICYSLIENEYGKMTVISKNLRHAFLTPLCFKVFLNCKFNYDLDEMFTKSLELVWKKAHED